MSLPPLQLQHHHWSIINSNLDPMSHSLSLVNTHIHWQWWVIGSWIMDHRSWIMDHGSWIIDHGSWIMDHGSWIMDHGSWIMDGCEWYRHHVEWM